MITSPHKPGYVYVMSNPSLEGWHKIGHTYRPPFKRADELSKTALPTPFEVEYAKFFWNAPSAEIKIHKDMVDKFGALKKKKEFFNVSVQDITMHLKEMPEPLFLSRPSLHVQEQDLQWEETIEGREELWSWAEQDLRAFDPAVQRNAWRQMEQLSAQGWAEGSWRLADLLLRKDMSIQGSLRAAWVLDAAYKQGLNEAKFKATWLRSWLSADAYQEFIKLFQSRIEKYGYSVENWPIKEAEIVLAEMQSWIVRPERTIAGNWASWQQG